MTFLIPLQSITTFKSARAHNGAHTRYAPCQTSHIQILLAPRNTVPASIFLRSHAEDLSSQHALCVQKQHFAWMRRVLERIPDLFPVKMVAMFYLRSSAPHAVCREDLDFAQSSSLTRTLCFARVWCCVDTASTDEHLATEDHAAFRCSNSQSGMTGAKKKTTFLARLSLILLDETLPRTIEWQW